MNDICEVRCIHADAVQRAVAGRTVASVLEEASLVFSVLGDPTRLRLVDALRQGELCVCDLAAVLGMSISAVSHQLRLLRTARVVRPRREGKIVFYSLDDEHVRNVLDVVLEHCRERSEA